MEDIIDIIVTETTNTIEITAQASDELIDVNIIDNREDITLNVTPTLVEININSLTGNFGVNWGDIAGTLADQTDLNTALGLKADLVGGKVPSSQLPSYVDDVVEVATYSALPATGETGKIYVILDTNKIYRWSGSVYVEIADSTAVWGAITGTLSSQTDLQSALNAKFDDPTGDTTQYIAGDGSLITFPVAGQAGTLVREVRNTTGATLTKGTVVYINGATGNKPTVSKALATGDSTSAQTFGLCQADIANNANGYVVCTGDIVGLDTSAISEGVQLYLSSTTAGTYTTTKQLAPAHLVYIGVVTRSHPTQGQIEVKIQNGYELDEIHDVAISSKANNDGLFYESSTSLWKNKSISTVLGYTPQAQLNGTGFVKVSGTTISYDNSTYALDSAVVKLTGNQTVAGVKTFTTGIIADVSTGGTQGFASTNSSASGSSIFLQNNSTSVGNAIGINNTSTADGISIGNDTSGRAIYISNATASGSGKGISIDNYNSGIGIEVGSDSTADAIKILHLSGRAFNIQSSGGGYGVIINNATAATSVPFTIQKQGANKITFTDAGAGTFVSTISAAGATLTGALSGTSSEFSGSNNFRQTDAGVFVKLGGNTTKANIYQFTAGGLAGAVFNIGHNFYYDGTAYGQDNTSKSGWVISSNLNADTFTIARAAAGSTSAPTSALTIASTGAATFSSSVTTGGTVTIGGASRLSSVAGNGLNFAIDSSDKMYLTTDGKLGIGVSPSYNLDVNGNGRFVGSTAVQKTGGGGTYQQTIVGQTTAAASGVSKKVAFIGHTHAITVYIWVTQNTSNSASGIAQFSSAYGSNSGGMTQANYIGNITSLNASYNNGGSPAYTLDITVAYTGSAPTINYTIIGVNNDNAIYTL